MNSYYKNAIIVFGIVVPLLCIVILGGISLFIASAVKKEHVLKSQVFKTAKQEELKMDKMQGDVAKNDQYLKNWRENINNETRGSFLAHWKEAENKFSGKDFSRSPANWINYSEGLGKGISQPASQVEMKFTGTYRAMQLALMEIETKLPQLQLDNFAMTPDYDAGKLNFSTTFTVWTKNQ